MNNLSKYNSIFEKIKDEIYEINRAYKTLGMISSGASPNINKINFSNDFINLEHDIESNNKETLKNEKSNLSNDKNKNDSINIYLSSPENIQIKNEILIGAKKPYLAQIHENNISINSNKREIMEINNSSNLCIINCKNNTDNNINNKYILRDKNYEIENNEKIIKNRLEKSNIENISIINKRSRLTINIF